MGDERVGLAVRVGSGFEVLVGAAVLAAGELPVGAQEPWPGRIEQHREVRAELLAQAGDPTGELWLHLFAAATDLPGEPDAGAVAGWLGRSDPARLRRAVVGADVPAWRQVLPAEVLDAAADGQPEAVARMLADRRHYAGRAAEVLAVLGPLDPATTQHRLVAAFDRLHRALPAGLEQQLHDAQRRFVNERVPADLRDPRAVLDQAAGGFHWAPEPGIRRLVLLPQQAAAPRLLLLQHRDARVVGVPVPTDDPDSLAGLSTALAAAADEQRLRILQLLSHHELGVSEVARRLGIAKSTAHHHLGALRRAGLIRLVGQAWRYAYRTRPEAPEELAARLRRLLAVPPAANQEARENDT